MYKRQVLNFWATWCAPCKKEMPSLEKLAQDLPQIDVYPINMEPPNKLRVRDWLQDIGVVSLNTYFDPKLDLAKKFKLIGVDPTIKKFHKFYKPCAFAASSLTISGDPRICLLRPILLNQKCRPSKSVKPIPPWTSVAFFETIFETSAT